MLTWYKNDDRQLAGEEVINDLSEQDVLRLFQMPFWNHAYLCNALEKQQHFSSLQAHTSHRLQPEKYSYFLEMFEIEDPLDTMQG